MASMTRRVFIGKVILGLVAFVPAVRVLVATGQGSLPSPDQPAPPPDPSEPPYDGVTKDPRFETGALVRSVDETMVIQPPYGGEVTLQISEHTLVCEGEWVKDIPAEIGDRITAWGQPMGEGHMVVEKLWVNFVALRGPVSSTTQLDAAWRLYVNDHREGPQVVILDPRTRIMDVRTAAANPGVPYEGKRFAESGLNVQEVKRVELGGRRLSDGTTVAVAMFVDA